MVGKPKYIDVNVFIYWLGGHPIYGERAHAWIKRIERASPREYVTSILTIYEALIVLAGLTGQTLRNIEFVGGVVEAFNGLRGLALEPLRGEDFKRAVELIDEYGFDYEDALHLSVALRTGSVAVITNDRDWDKAPIPRVF